MAVNMRVHKMIELPAEFEASALYLIQGEDDLLDLYVSSNDGLTARNIISKTEIAAMIAAAELGAGSGSLSIAADINALNALTPTEVTMVLVLDASADASVTAGAATYVYNPGTEQWIKIAEHESMDVALEWANIQDGPTSTAQEIDDAVAASHAHANLAVLDKFDEDQDEQPMYNGEYFHAYLSNDQW